MTKLPLQNNIRDIDMICFAKPGLAEDLYSAQGRIFNNMLYVRYVHLTESHTYSYETNIFSSETMLCKDYDNKGSIERKKMLWSWASRGLAPRRADGW
jgi:hypothetical protein